jgi:hypothetical protein
MDTALERVITDWEVIISPGQPHLSGQACFSAAGANPCFPWTVGRDSGQITGNPEVISRVSNFLFADDLTIGPVCQDS